MNDLFARAAKIDPKSPDCVRFHTKRGMYELVVDGKVTASCSRFGMTVPNKRRAFVEKVQAAARAKRSDELVDRLFPENKLS